MKSPKKQSKKEINLLSLLKELATYTGPSAELWSWEIKKKLAESLKLAVEKHLPNGTDAQRAEWYSGMAELERQAQKPMTPEKLAAHKAMLDEKQATAAVQIRHVNILHEKGKELIGAVIGVGDKYLALCKAIRENEMAPKLVSFELGQLGFSRQTVSKINKVAGASDELWNSFEARAFGFNKMLELSRGEKPNEATLMLADKMGADVVDVVAQVQKLETDEVKEGAENPELVEPSLEELDKKAELAAEKAAAVLLRSRATLDWRSGKKFVGGDGWVVIVQKDKSWKAPTPTTEGGPKSPTMAPKK